MSGPLPSRLYKYLPLEYAEAMLVHGEVVFSSLAWFQNYEDEERGDRFEGAHKYFPLNGLEVTRVARDGQSHVPVKMTLPSDSLHSKARGRDRQYEYRFAFGTKREVFDFENVEYHIVREGQPYSRASLEKAHHRMTIRLGSLEHCCRLL